MDLEDILVFVAIISLFVAGALISYFLPVDLGY